jgi:hypothetical protein
MLALLMVACAAPISEKIKPNEANIAKYNDLSALDVVTSLENSVKEANESGMSFMAPHYFREASQLLTESQNGLSSKPKAQLVQQAAKGDAILEKGRAIMSIVQYRFVKELELKTQLDKLNTAKNLPKEYEKVMGDFSGLIEKVEREQPDNIDKNKEALLKSMQELEVRSVQENALHISETINAESKVKNADKQVPATYAEALRVFQEAKAQIAAAHHDDELVQRLGLQALFAAHHAQQVNDRVVELQAQFKGTGSSAAPSLALATGGAAGVAHIGAQIAGNVPTVEKAAVEKIALQEEDRLLSISTALGQKDLRDLPLDKQVLELKRISAEISAQAKNEVGIASMKDLDAKLKTANDATQQAMAQLAQKDKQIADQAAKLADQEVQLADQAALLTEKDTQLAKLNEAIAQLESKGKAKHK